MNANKNIPQHIAIIMDGNARWSKARKLPTIAGHKAGAESLRRIIEHAANIGVRHLTLYSFSTENWRRTQKWIDELLSLIKFYLASESANMVKNGVKLRFIGDLERFSPDLQKLIRETTEKTANGSSIEVILALSYSGRDEILRMMKKMLEKSHDPVTLTEETISQWLDTKDIPDPELMIRTSGEVRISNFMLWQLAYTEFVFTSTLWPDFTKNDLDAAISEFQQRQRRFGKDSS